MEQFGARKETPLETCINEVKRSDIYIGIISQRLGSLEPTSGKSYTQLEYEKAIELNKEILIYLIDEENALIHPVHSEHGENYEQLNNFKQMLKEKHTVDFYRDPKDIVDKLKSRLSEILIDTQPENNSEKVKATTHLLEKFHLLPKKFNNREVRLKIKFLDDAFPLSKQACNLLGYNFGETLCSSFELIEPSIDTEIKHIIISEDATDIYFDNKKNQEIEIIARLLFSSERINRLEARFSDKTYSYKVKNPDYDPNNVMHKLLSRSSSDFYSSFYNPEYITETETINSDSILLLGLSRKVQND